jgi:hypothetical protein
MSSDRTVPVAGTITEQGWQAFQELVQSARILEASEYEALLEKACGRVYERWLGAQFLHLCEEWNAAKGNEVARLEIRARMRLTAYFGLGNIKLMEGPIEELNNLRRIATP